MARRKSVYTNTSPRPPDSATFLEWLEYFMKQRNWTRKDLADHIRRSESYVYGLFRGKRSVISFRTLMSICLALRLKQGDYEALMTSVGITLSPAYKLHRIFKRLLEEYAKKSPQYNDSVFMLDYADAYLVKEGYEPLPSKYYKEKLKGRRLVHLIEE